MSYKFPKLVNESHYIRIFTDDLALFVFIPNESNLDQSIKDFVKLRSEKRMYNKEFWLFDISPWPTVYHAGKAIEKIPLNLESDLYLYKTMGLHYGIALWDHYEIHTTVPRQLLTYGQWNDLDGLKIVEKAKWPRRRNMKGANLRILSEPWAPYTVMTPINEAGDVYEMTGYYAEMWHNLQVMNIHAIMLHQKN